MAKINSTVAPEGKLHTEKSKSTGKSAETDFLASIRDPDYLIMWMRGLVTEWTEKQDKVLCVACAGYAFAHGNGNPVEGGVFAQIEDELGDMSLSNSLENGLNRMEDLLKAGHGEFEMKSHRAQAT